MWLQTCLALGGLAPTGVCLGWLETLLGLSSWRSFMFLDLGGGRGPWTGTQPSSGRGRA